MYVLCCDCAPAGLLPAGNWLRRDDKDLDEVTRLYVAQLGDAFIFIPSDVAIARGTALQPQ